VTIIAPGAAPAAAHARFSTLGFTVGPLLELDRLIRLPGTRPGTSLLVAQAIAAAVVVTRFARGRRRRAALSAAAPPPAGSVSIVVPARDEEARLGSCLEGLRGAGAEVLVVDDQSTDGTAQLARSLGATVIAGAAPPAGWVGKPWALQQGLDRARGEWVVFLDADTRPKDGLIPALVDAATDSDLLSAGPRFVCVGAGERLLHPAMAATLPYRFGPADAEGWQPSAHRAIANGQCVVVRREPFAAAGGWGRVRGNLSEDIALARSLRAAGWRVGFADASGLLDVRMYDSARETWTGWGRSLMGAGATDPLRQAADVAVLWLAVALPLPRLLSGRGTPLDALLVAIRIAIHVALARSYAPPRGLPYALAPLADVPVAAWLSWSALRPSRTWRGRTYDPPAGSAGR
jgi:dolichol-phosphate mannosyltransferase